MPDHAIIRPPFESPCRPPCWATIFVLMMSAMQPGRSEDNWPQFRGPGGQGHSHAANLPADWQDAENIRWKTPMPGRGWSSPVMMDGRVWLTTALETDGSEELRVRQLEGDQFANSKDVVQSVSLHAIGLDFHSGTILYDIGLADIDEPTPIHSLNSYASPTPVLDHGRLYCHFGRFGVFCIDVNSGEVPWRQQLKETHSVGPGSSPILAGQYLILTCDGLEEQYIAALDKDSGDLAWRTNRPPLMGDNKELLKAFSTPILIGSAQNQQIFVPGAQWAAAYAPSSGQELWRINHGDGFSTVPRPVAANGVVYFFTGFSGKGLLAIRTNGQGDVTESHVEWNQPDIASTRPSPVIVGKHIYSVTERGVASCVDIQTGDVVWRQRVGGNYSASLLVAQDRIYAFSEEGVVTVFQHGSEYHEIEKHDLGERIMASPAIVADSILLRTESFLYRIGSSG